MLLLIEIIIGVTDWGRRKLQKRGKLTVICFGYSHLLENGGPSSTFHFILITKCEHCIRMDWLCIVTILVVDCHFGAYLMSKERPFIASGLLHALRILRDLAVFPITLFSFHSSI
jgi:hypothetical protein